MTLQAARRANTAARPAQSARALGPSLCATSSAWQSVWGHRGCAPRRQPDQRGNTDESHRHGSVRMIAAVLGTILAVTGAAPAVAVADPASCNDPSCTPGIRSGAVLGGPCEDTAHYVYAVTSWGRLVFCGSPRRYQPRYFRSPPMYGVKDENSSCEGFENDVAQAPDGLFLTCVVSNGEPTWRRGDA